MIVSEDLSPLPSERADRMLRALAFVERMETKDHEALTELCKGTDVFDVAATLAVWVADFIRDDGLEVLDQVERMRSLILRAGVAV